LWISLRPFVTLADPAEMLTMKIIAFSEGNVQRLFAKSHLLSRPAFMPT